MPQPTRFVLSDMDGVIRHFPKNHEGNIERQFGLPSGDFARAAFAKDLLTDAVCGRISDEEWHACIVTSLMPTVGAEIAQAAVDAWAGDRGCVDHAYLKLVAARFPDAPLTILTNGTTRIPQDLEILDLADSFFRVFNTADIGVCKPDPRIFAHVCEVLSCAAAEMLFIDDSAGHVEAAKGLGFRTHLYKGLAGFIDFLDRNP